MAYTKITKETVGSTGLTTDKAVVGSTTRVAFVEGEVVEVSPKPGVTVTRSESVVAKTQRKHREAKTDAD